jgi:anti-sigma-K factor RskA
MANRRDHIPDYLLEQYALGELSPKQMAKFDQRVSTDSNLAARLDAIDASNRAILQEHPPEEFARLVNLRHRVDAVAAEEQARSSRRIAYRRWLMLAPACAAVLVLLVILSQSDESLLVRTHPIGIVEHTREKGLEPHLRIFRKVDDIAELLTTDSTVRNGNMLQIGYVAHGRPFGVILSIDGRGVVTLHYPDDPTTSTRLDQDGEIHVPHAYEIDDAPDFERFFFVTASAPIEVDSVLAAARRLAHDPKRAKTDTLILGEGFRQSMTLIRKQEVQK